MTTRFLIKEPPLLMVAAELRFSAMPTFSEDQLRKLHSELMQIGYPERIDTPMRQYQLVLGPEAPAPLAEPIIANRTAFRAVGKRRIFYVMQDSVFIKFTEHHSFNATFAEFEKLLSTVEKVFTELTFTTVQHLGLRYSNLIVPQKGKSLGDYADGEILPHRLPIDDAVLPAGIMAAQAQTKRGGLLRLLVERVPAIEGKVSKVLPDDLIDLDPRTALSIPSSNKWAELTTDSYAILDIDHQLSLSDAPRYDRGEIAKQFHALHCDICSVFESVLKEDAKKEWGFEQKVID